MIGSGMMGGSSFGVFGWVGLVINLVFTVGVILGIIWLVVWLVRRTNTSEQTGFFPAGAQSPMDILQIRYARGEITREQYEIMSQDVQ